MKINKYVRSEIDRFASANFYDNFDGAFPILDIGDLYNTFDRLDEIGNIDLVVGGFPCQSFSLSGRMGGIYNDHKNRGIIIFEICRVIKELRKANPDLKILLENVSMKKSIMAELTDLISDAMGQRIEPIKLNSGDVSAQNRQRIYWTNIKGFTIPKLNVRFGDIMETDCDEIYDLSEAHKNRVLNAKRGKGYFYTKDSPKIGTINALYGKNPTDGSFVEDIKLNQVGVASNINGHDILKRIYSRDGKMPTLNTNGGGNREPKVAIGAFRGRYNEDGSTSQQLEIRTDHKTNTLTTVQKDNVPINLDNLRWRKISVLEAERMQTVADGATEFGIFKDDNDKRKKLSNTQRYKMLGNGFTIKMISAILEPILNDKGLNILSFCDGMGGTAHAIQECIHNQVFLDEVG